MNSDVWTPYDPTQSSYIASILDAGLEIGFTEKTKNELEDLKVTCNGSAIILKVRFVLGNFVTLDDG